MCELLAIMRRIPIEPPGGLAAAAGDPSNPAYSVTVTDAEAAEARAKAAAAAEEKRMFPVGSGAAFLEEAKSSSMQRPAGEMMAGLAGRHGSMRGARPSQGSLRRSSSQGSGSERSAGYGQPAGPYQYYQTPPPQR